ncbi:hypothetical protein M8C21_032870 [Ambrosia artemisiifolia]|uniref:Uncharacterized protein n=1 Tax=Ambrosia artemisiifolia TaxID=4212 RepID=A0AAD5CS22_AMBAR|nr:hypothetical protein M8C21_032870 [Ambrosia artemisiifolia]
MTRNRAVYWGIRQDGGVFGGHAASDKNKTGIKGQKSLALDTSSGVWIIKLLLVCRKSLAMDTTIVFDTPVERTGAVVLVIVDHQHASLVPYADMIMADDMSTLCNDLEFNPQESRYWHGQNSLALDTTVASAASSAAVGRVVARGMRHWGLLLDFIFVSVVNISLVKSEG